ncbi:MAG TPA: hypothetical protein GX718_06300 [Brevibacterium sp.]|nr:hypothetical protein [Brevibacterium sp.]
MSEAIIAESTDAPAQDVENEQPQPPVEDTDWKAEARKWEQRAKENKSAAEELSQIKDAQKSDAERAADALAQAQADAESARAELLRYRVAAEHGITDAEDIALFLTGTDADTLTKQAARLAARAVDESKPRIPRPDPNQGRSGDAAASTADQFAGVVGGFLNQ